MIEGIILTIGVVFVITAKILYCLFGVMVGKKRTDNNIIWYALVADGLGVALIVIALLNYLSIW